MNLRTIEIEPGGWGVEHNDPSGNRWEVCGCGHRTASEATRCAAASLERHGRIAFEAYNAAVGGVTWDDKPIPVWEAVTDKVREGWRTAAFAARQGAKL